MSKVEYCIWTRKIGQMDSSTDWGYLYKLACKYLKSNFSIIPVESVGKGNYMTLRQIREYSDKIMAEAKRNMREHDKFMKEHEEWKKKHHVGKY